jgi:MFS transporter, DHA3 family, multidrug efflux protein
MRTFYQILANALVASVTNNFVWFALTFWAYLETQSVLATSFVGGSYLAATALSGIWFGSLVDHNKKKIAMLISSIATLILFSLGLLLYTMTPLEVFKSIDNVTLWIFILVLLAGVIAGNVRNIALPTLVTLLVSEDVRDRANGLSGSMMGVSFSITAVTSGLVLGYYGMLAVLILAIVFTLLSIVHLIFISIPEKEITYSTEQSKKLDLKGTIAAVGAVPGLFALIFFSTFNNLLGGVFMSLMDAYGLTLVSVQTWGMMWGFLSLGFIFGGLLIARRGLGKNPLHTLLTVNLVMWTISIFFTLQPSILLLAIGMFIWICLVPFAEASEQTIIQKVVPAERQGRVFGFAQSMEQAASPLTAFLIGPIAQFIFIPFMTTGAGVELIGSWYGVGPGRGMALLFSFAGCIGLILTIFALRSRSYRLLSKRYLT